MGKRVFSPAELEESAYACYEDRIVHGFMCEDFMGDTTQCLNEKYTRLQERVKWQFRYAISEIVYDNFKLFQVHDSDPDDQAVKREIAHCSIFFGNLNRKSDNA